MLCWLACFCLVIHNLLANFDTFVELKLCDYGEHHKS